MKKVKIGDLYLMKTLKTCIIFDNPGFLGYKVNISFLTEITYSQICGTKLGTSYNNGVIIGLYLL